MSTNTTRELPEGVFGSTNQQASLVIENKRIRAEGVADFIVTEPGTGRPLFSASRPTFQLSRKSIKKIALEQIVTNKVMP